MHFLGKCLFFVLILLFLYFTFRYAALQASKLPASPLQTPPQNGASSSNNHQSSITGSSAGGGGAGSRKGNSNANGNGGASDSVNSANNDNANESALDLPPTAEEIAQRAAALDARRAEDARREEIAFKASFLMQQVYLAHADSHLLNFHSIG